MSKFRVGDVCEIVGAQYRQEHIGLECTVVEVDIDDHEWTYRCEIPGTKNSNGLSFWWARQEHLRLKRPKAWDRWLTDFSHLDSPIEEKA